MDSGPDVDAPLTVMASNRNPLTSNWSHPAYTSATMSAACSTVHMLVEILRTHVRLYRPVAISESMPNDRNSENTNRVRCGTPDHRPIYNIPWVTTEVRRFWHDRKVTGKENISFPKHA